ncbi:hypothetical protein [Burkholderia guangdongensis]|uniref:hypothetical protein n=1 Tax=Burkholderia guangdongensis TaxID=1792500 RepID=UPI0015CA9E48|nr:hypothetical protein [Burkholderia guangdongensis]
MYFAICSKEPTHTVKHSNWEVIENAACMHCDGRYKVIRNKTTNAPRDYAGKSAIIKRGDASFETVPVDFTTRLTRSKRESASDASDEPPSKRRALVRTDYSDSDSDSDDDTSDLEDRDWIGLTEPFKGVYSRLSIAGTYEARDDLEDIIGRRASKPKMKLKNIGLPVHRGAGQAAAKGKLSATDASGRNLPSTSISSITGHPKSVVSEEWCHLWASCLGGPTTSDNLVAASYACNTFMMAIETNLKSRTDLCISVSAYCSDANGNVADAIRYKIFEVGTGKELFNRLIDATAQHFSRSDLMQLQQDLAPLRKER